MSEGDGGIWEFMKDKKPDEDRKWPPSDEELIAVYGELGSVHKVGELYGVGGGSVHYRLKKLGASKPMDVFTDDERERLIRDYAAYREIGKVSDLANEMGRTVQFLSRQAKELGLTAYKYPKKQERYFWASMSDDLARTLFDDFKASPLGLGQYCEKNGYDVEGLRKAIRGRWPDEWEPVIESKQPISTKYRLGRRVEYWFRDKLQADGYFVMRSPGSKSPVDLVAIKPGQVLFVQCKRGGSLPPKEWNAIYDLAVSSGAVPVMAENPFPREHRMWRLTGRKDGSKRRQPMERFFTDPVEEEKFHAAQE